IGFRALAISANYASQEEGEDGEVETELSRGALIFAFAIAIGFAVMVFKVGPALITDQLPVHRGGWFVIVEGLIRVPMFIAYLPLISSSPAFALFISSLSVCSRLPLVPAFFHPHGPKQKAINA